MVASTTHPKTVLADSLRKLLRRGALGHVVNLLSKLRPADVATLFKDLTEREKTTTFKILAERDPARAGLILREFHAQPGLDYLNVVDLSRRAAIFKEMDPDDANTYLMKGQILILEGDREGVLSNMDKVLELDPENEKAHQILEQIGG